MWVLLLLLTVIPLGGMGLVVTPSLRDSARVVEGIRQTEAHVDALNSLMVLRSTLYSEQVAAEAVVRAQDLGLTLSLVSDLLGFDIAARMSSSRELVDQAVRIVKDQGLAVPAAFDTAIPRLRAQVDAGTADAVLLHQIFGDATQMLTDEVDSELGLIVSSATTTSGLAGGVEAATHRLVDLFDLLKAGQDEVNALFQSTMTTTDADKAIGRRSLTDARALYLRNLATVEHAASPAVAVMLAALHTDPDVTSFNAAVDAELASSAGSAPDLVPLGAAFRSSFVRSDRLTAMLRTASDEASNIAAVRRAEAGERLRNQFLLMTALVLVTTGAALAIARSITGRLRPLAAKAERVSQGHLDDAPVDERGPRRGGDRRPRPQRGRRQPTPHRIPGLSPRGAAISTIPDSPCPQPVHSGNRCTPPCSACWTCGRQANSSSNDSPTKPTTTCSPGSRTARPHSRGSRWRSAAPIVTATPWSCCSSTSMGSNAANDAHGHHVGDLILRTCADRMQSTVRAGDLLARLGGDEFLVITERIESVRDAVELSERLIASISEPIELDGVTSRVGASIGIGISLDGHATALDLIRDADNAVHRAKSLGRGRVEIFDESAAHRVGGPIRPRSSAARRTHSRQPVPALSTCHRHHHRRIARLRSPRPVDPRRDPRRPRSVHPGRRTIRSDQ